MVPKILIIDDELDFLKMMQECLSKIGYNVIAFNDPFEGFKYFKLNSSEIVVIITDWRMPKMNGLVFANQVRQLNIMVKIVMLTAYDIGIVKACPEYETAKMYKIIQKPIRLLFLKNLLKEMTDNKC
ncbi:MAG: response regulator [Candidatus Nitrosocosmicus sp.]